MASIPFPEGRASPWLPGDQAKTRFSHILCRLVTPRSVLQPSVDVLVVSMSPALILELSHWNTIIILIFPSLVSGCSRNVKTVWKFDFKRSKLATHAEVRRESPVVREAGGSLLGPAEGVLAAAGAGHEVGGVDVGREGGQSFELRVELI